MSVRVVNPDSAVLDQLEGHWQKLATLILWKTCGRKVLRITDADMDAFIAEFKPGEPVLFTHGRFDALEFSIVDQAAAERIAAHNATQRGNA